MKARFEHPAKNTELCTDVRGADNHPERPKTARGSDHHWKAETRRPNCCIPTPVAIKTSAAKRVPAANNTHSRHQFHPMLGGGGLQMIAIVFVAADPGSRHLHLQLIATTFAERYQGETERNDSGELIRRRSCLREVDRDRLVSNDERT